MSNINYSNSVEKVNLDDLSGFFNGWQKQPSDEKFLQLLKKSDFIWLAHNETELVGFITAVSDNTLSAYIPFLEVKPKYQGNGIGTELMQRMLDTLSEFYMIDLSCDEDMNSFYEKFNMTNSTGMRLRNYDKI